MRATKLTKTMRVLELESIKQKWEIMEKAKLS